MRRSLLLLEHSCKCGEATAHNASRKLPFVCIKNAEFYRNQPSSTATEQEQLENPSLFPRLEFSLPAQATDQHWCIIGPSNAGKTTFLQLLEGKHLCFPPRSRAYPYLSSNEIRSKGRGLSQPDRAIHYVGFDQRDRGFAHQSLHMGSRYESRREAVDFSVFDYITRNTHLNAPREAQGPEPGHQHLNQIIFDLRLTHLVGMPLTSLSNGQRRRAKLARALLGQPELLLLDEPFMGLDPPTIIALSILLQGLAKMCRPRLLLALRPQDPIPDWITHILYIGKKLTVTHQGPKLEINKLLTRLINEEVGNSSGFSPYSKTSHSAYNSRREFGQCLMDIGIGPNPEMLPETAREQWYKAKACYDSGLVVPNLRETLRIGQATGISQPTQCQPRHVQLSEPLIEMKGVSVRYGDKVVLGDWDHQVNLNLDISGKMQVDCNLAGTQADKPNHGLWWNVRRGERWAIVGPNGSGKTTLLSLLLSDHPQSYSVPLRIFGQDRLPSPGRPGLSLFDIQSRMGHSSPEVHSFFPRQLSLRQTVESAFAETPRSRPRLSAEVNQRVDACLCWFEEDLNPHHAVNSITKEQIVQTKHAPRTLPYIMEQASDVRKAGLSSKSQKYAPKWAKQIRFGEMAFSAQRVALFLRAIVAQPDVVVLDEAFSGMDDLVREKCLLFLDHGNVRRQEPDTGDNSRVGGTSTLSELGAEHTIRGAGQKASSSALEGLTGEQALIVVSHVQEELPKELTHWLYLPSGGHAEPCKLGSVEIGGLKNQRDGWNQIWSTYKP